MMYSHKCKASHNTSDCHCVAFVLCPQPRYLSYNFMLSVKFYKTTVPHLRDGKNLSVPFGPSAEPQHGVFERKAEWSQPAREEFTATIWFLTVAR